jgi:hypothetical protein
LQGARKKVLLAEAEVRTVFLGASDILGLQQRFLAMLGEAWAAFPNVRISAVFDQVLRLLLCRLWRGPHSDGGAFSTGAQPLWRCERQGR